MVAPGGVPAMADELAVVPDIAENGSPQNDALPLADGPLRGIMQLHALTVKNVRTHAVHCSDSAFC